MNQNINIFIESPPMTEIDSLIQKIYEYRDESETQLFYQFNISYIIDYVNADIINDMEKSFRIFNDKINIVDFVRIMLNLINHNENETIYLVLALIDMFKEISQQLDMKEVLMFKDISDFICDQFTGTSDHSDEIPTKILPPQQQFNRTNQYRLIDLEAPSLFGQMDENIRQLTQNQIYTDSIHHPSRVVQQGFYAKEINRIITMDSLAENLSVFDVNCKLQQNITIPFQNDIEEWETRGGGIEDNKQKKSLNSSTNINNQKNSIFLALAWSELQQRVGIALKDYSLCFFDAQDNFEFCKHFQTQNHVPDLQLRIWFLQSNNMWITSDNQNSIHIWDLQSQRILETLSDPEITQNIFDIVEMDSIKLVAVGSLDKKITIWDFNTKTIVLQIPWQDPGVNKLQFFNSYQILLAAGFETMVSLCYINPVFQDWTLRGKLIGHTVPILTMEVIENTPMIVTADELGIIRIWDIRTQKCIQTLELGSQTIISKLISIFERGKLAFLGTRINVLDFDDQNQIIKKSENPEPFFPIKVEYHGSKDQLIICTRQDLRFINVMNGRTKSIYTGFNDDEKDEITAFQSIQSNHAFILGNHQGELLLYNYTDGQRINKLVNHNHQLTALKFDYSNQLLVTAGWDANIQLQHIHGNQTQLQREIKGLFQEKHITLLEISVHHNIIIAGSQTETLFVFDYEFFQLIGQIKLEKKKEPTAISIMNGFPIVAIGTSDGYLFLLSFTIHKMQIIFNIVAKIDTTKPNNIEQNSKQGLSQYATPIIQKTPYMIGKGSNGIFSNLDINKEFPQSQQIFFTNKEPDIESEQNSLNSQNESKLFSPNRDDKQNQDTEQSQLKQNPSAVNTSNNVIKICIDFDTQPQTVSKIERAYLFCAIYKGMLHLYDITPLFDQYKIEYSQAANKRNNYNPHRGVTENMKNLLEKFKFKPFLLYTSMPISGMETTDGEIALLMPIQNKLKIDAHRDVINSMNIINLQKQVLVTSSLDCYVKIWTFEGELQGSLNINHPLPIQWNIQIDPLNQAAKKIVLSIRIVDLIFKKYKNDIGYKEEKNIKISDFLSSLEKNYYVQKSKQMMRRIFRQQDNIILKDQTFDHFKAAATSKQAGVIQLSDCIGQQYQKDRQQAFMDSVLGTEIQVVVQEEFYKKVKSDLLSEFQQYRKIQENQAQINSFINVNNIIVLKSQLYRQIQSDIGFREERTIKRESIETNKARQINQINLIELNQDMAREQIIKMNDEYSPRDLKFQITQNLFSEELNGPSLQRMENNQRFAVSNGALLEQQQKSRIQAAAQTDQMKEYEKIIKDLNPDYDKIFHQSHEHRQSLMNYLDADFRKKIIDTQNMEMFKEMEQGTNSQLQNLEFIYDYQNLKKKYRQNSSSNNLSLNANLNKNSISVLHAASPVHQVSRSKPKFSQIHHPNNHHLDRHQQQHQSINHIIINNNHLDEVSLPAIPVTNNMDSMISSQSKQLSQISLFLPNHEQSTNQTIDMNDHSVDQTYIQDSVNSTTMALNSRLPSIEISKNMSQSLQNLKYAQDFYSYASDKKYYVPYQNNTFISQLNSPSNASTLTESQPRNNNNQKLREIMKFMNDQLHQSQNNLKFTTQDLSPNSQKNPESQIVKNYQKNYLFINQDQNYQI